MTSNTTRGIDRDEIAGSDNAPAGDDLAFRANDERFADYKRRTKEEKREASARLALGDPKRRAATYRRLVTLTAKLTHAEARFLCVLTYEWGRQLEDCFPSYSTINAALPGQPRQGKKGTIERVKKLLASCTKKGFLRRVHLTRMEVGEDAIEMPTGRFTSSVGFQFCLPPSVITKHAEGWEGPRSWKNRVYVPEE